MLFQSYQSAFREILFQSYQSINVSCAEQQLVSVTTAVLETLTVG